MCDAAPGNSYIIAATPRTGSSLLCEALEATGIAGRPYEVFAPHYREQWCNSWSIAPSVSFSAYLDVAKAFGATSNGVYGVKILWMHISDLAQAALGTSENSAARSDDVLTRLFPCAMYINMVRRDRLAQAVSLYKALATNEWTLRRTEEEQKNEFKLPRPITGQPRFDPEAIRACEAYVVWQQESWRQFFARHGITPLTVVYEELDKDYQGQVARVLRFLGVDDSVVSSIPRTRLVRQADRGTRRWLRLMRRQSIRKEAPCEIAS